LIFPASVARSEAERGETTNGRKEPAIQLAMFTATRLQLEKSMGTQTGREDQAVEIKKA